MRAGYPWTGQLAPILPLALAYRETNVDGVETGCHYLELLGGLEMDAWIAARQTKPLHIWSRYCMGRQGIEASTALPRPLLDLISRVSRHEDVSHDLFGYANGLAKRNDFQALYWRTYALTAILHLHGLITTQYDAKETTEQLMIVVRQIIEILETNRNHNIRILVWPMYVLAQNVLEEEDMKFIAKIIRRISETHGNARLLCEAIGQCAPRMSVLMSGIGTLTSLPADFSSGGVELGLW